MHEFWYDQVKPKYIKTDDIYKDIAEDVKTRFDASIYELNRSLLKRKSKKVIGVMKNELGGKIMNEFIGLRSKTYSYLTDNNDEGSKRHKKGVIKRKLNFEDYKNCLEATQRE